MLDWMVGESRFVSVGSGKVAALYLRVGRIVIVGGEEG